MKIWYTCIHEVILRRGDDMLGVVFTAGQVYQVQRYDGRDAVLINDAGGEHLMSPKHLTDWFRPVKEQPHV